MVDVRLPLDHVLPGDCLAVLPTLPAECASLVFTSPPYNVAKGYEAGSDGRQDGDLTLDEWLDWLDRVWRECVRCLRPGGHLVVNVPEGTGRSPVYVPVGALTTVHMAALPGAFLHGIVIWRKGPEHNDHTSGKGGTAWGSWCSPSAPALRDVHEILVVVRKEPVVARGKPEGLRPTVPGVAPDISPEDFVRGATSVWSVQPVSAEVGGCRWHPCAFPVRLAERAIRFWTYPGDTVLDPFAGSGTAGVAARGLGRRFIGCELNSEWAARAQARIEGAAVQTALPWGEERVRG